MRTQTQTPQRLAFLSYRRDESAEAAQAIYSQLKVHFGSGQLFMDVNSISPGDKWPSHIRENLNRASGMLVLVGRRWLHSADQWGRRRIDAEDDWVSREISTALDSGIPIIPVLVGKGVKVPPKKALPSHLKRLFSSQVHRVRPESWFTDLQVLVRLCKKKFRLVEPPDLQDVVAPVPDPRKQKRRPVAADVLSSFLERSSKWEAWKDSLPREYPVTRQELRKNFIFDSFRDAIEFMQRASVLFERERHHPRWTNEWRLVTVRLTTWDAGNHITTIDLAVAAKLDKLYNKFVSSKRRRGKSDR